MKDHTVEINPGGSEEDIIFAPVFNVSIPFVDRHLEEGRGAKVAIRTNHNEAVSYSELAANVNRCGNFFTNLGMEKGARVIMVVKDCPEFFYIFWGAIKAGFVPIPINTLLRAKDYSFIIHDSGCSMVVYSPEYEEEVGPALSQVKEKPEHIILVDGEGETIKQMIPKQATELSAVKTAAEDICFMLYSSGSTGSPKGAIHCHKDMVVTSHFYAVETLGMKEDDICFSAAKLFFAYGHGNGMHFPLWLGASSVLFDGRPTPETTFEMIEKFKPTLYFGVPTLYGAQLMSMETEKPDLSSVRLCVSAGEALPPDLFNRWKAQTGLTILDGIGSTEILHIFISNQEGDVKPGSSGRVVKGYQAKILGEDGAEVKQGDSGNLWIKGGSTAKYYWNNPQKSAETMRENWLNTGDTYYQDADGYYHYCGRNDDMLKVGGIWCSPFEIEAKLIEHPKVLEAAVVGCSDDQELIKPKAFIVLKEATSATEEISEELLQLCKKGLAPYKYPRWFVYQDELPKTATGKIQRFRLR